MSSHCLASHLPARHLTNRFPTPLIRSLAYRALLANPHQNSWHRYRPHYQKHFPLPLAPLLLFFSSTHFQGTFYCGMSKKVWCVTMPERPLRPPLLCESRERSFEEAPQLERMRSSFLYKKEADEVLVPYQRCYIFTKST